jgi:uncharacterized protein
MKPSRYTFAFPVDPERTLLYNALWNGLALVDAATAGALETMDPSVLAPGELHDNLRRGGFLIPEEEDELRVLQLRWRMAQFDTGTLSLTLAPTLDCNLRCTYCFESHPQIAMDEATEETLATFVARHLEQGTKRLDILWYGGEPLLALPAMERMTAKFRALAEEHHAEYHASIITNGTLLDRPGAERLRAMGIHGAQITLDGPREAHDRRRPYTDGSGSFEDITRSLGAVGELLDLAIRMNVDRTNRDAAMAFARELRQAPWFDPDRHLVYFGHVQPFTSSCHCSHDELMRSGEFARSQFELEQETVAAGLAEPRYPAPAFGCVATRMNAWLVGPQGELYKCLNHLGDPAQVVGHVSEPLRPTPRFLDYLLDGFEGDAQCRACRYLPLCMGGCVDIRYKQKEGLPVRDCTVWKHTLDRTLRLVLERRIDTGAQEAP